MKNVFRGKPWLIALLGIAVGAGGYAGVNALIDSTQSKSAPSAFFSGTSSKHEEPSIYDVIPADSLGDCLITVTGSKYHAVSGCSYLRNSKQVKRVKSKDAISNGLEPCSKCFKQSRKRHQKVSQPISKRAIEPYPQF